MTSQRMVRLVLIGALSTVILGAGVAPAGASTSKSEEHCTVEVIGQEPDGEYILGEEECYSEFGDAMEAVGLGADIEDPADAREAMMSIQSTLAVHYDASNYTGASISVSGVDCLGGYINLSLAWDNRISSTISTFCGRIRHWTGLSKTGNSQDTLPSGALSSPVNNNSSSIQYLN